MKVTWLGDDDQSVREVQVYGLTFPVGEAVEVPDDHPRLSKLQGNPCFVVGEMPEGEAPKRQRKAKA